MLVMVLFGITASYKYNSYLTSNGTVPLPSFWRFEVVFPLLLFAIIFGMRYDVGVDHLAYMRRYLDHIYVGRMEPLFFFFSDLGWFFNLHYTVYFGILAFIQVFFFFYAFKDERFLFPFLAFFLFTSGAFFFWMNVIRQAMAMCIWIYSLKYIEEKKLLLYAAWGIAAVFLHKSAITLFIFYPILRNGKDYFKSISLQLILFGSAFVIRSFFYQISIHLEPIVNFYISFLGADLYEKSYNLNQLSSSFKENQGTGLAYLFIIMVNILIILYSKKIKAFYKGKRFLIIYFFFFLGLITSYVFPSGLISFTRPFRYFYVFQPIMFSSFTYYLYKNRNDGKNYLLFLGVITAFLGIFFLSQYSADKFSHSLYQFYFQHNFEGYPNTL
jgi:hypothetical protein